MRHLSFLFISVLISCNTVPVDDKVEDKTTTETIIEPVELVDFGFDPNHPNSEQFNFMLNEYNDEFLVSEIDWSPWENEHLILNRYSYRTVGSNLDLYLIFCSHQNDCISICQANFEPQNNNLIWGVNGGVAFVVSGENIDEINQLVGFLAGEE